MIYKDFKHPSVCILNQKKYAKEYNSRLYDHHSSLESRNLRYITTNEFAGVFYWDRYCIGIGNRYKCLMYDVNMLTELRTQLFSKTVLIYLFAH